MPNTALWTHVKLCTFMLPPVPPRREGGGRYKLPGPNCRIWIFVFLGSIIICRFYKLAFKTKPQVAQQLTGSPSDLVWRFLANSP